AMLFLPAGEFRTMVLIDLPLCFGTTGSIAAFYAPAEVRQGRSAWGAIKRLPLLIGLGAGLAPHLSGAVWSGLRSMAGEFVRTPKKGEGLSRYRMGARIPLAELGLGLYSCLSVVAALQTGHWFAAPFAGLFAWGYLYVGYQVVRDQYGAPLLAGSSEEPAVIAEPA
ncbi:MAG: glycosyltransferase, partial [Polyangiaceae bacterium]|nr:glycosyltransferase [Polyangiaceae bacterium]